MRGRGPVGGLECDPVRRTEREPNPGTLQHCQTFARFPGET